LLINSHQESVMPKLISLFSGAGGMDIGFSQAGFETAVAVEFDPSCCKTLRINMPNVPIIEGDINDIQSSEILEKAKLKPLEADVLVGGPPCQSFSLAGKRKGLNDPRGKLVWEYFRVVRDTLPKVFVMENVKGMVNWSNGDAIQSIVETAKRIVTYKRKKYSYKVTLKVLNAVNYGAAQFRERIFLVGNRLGKDFTFPHPNHSSPDDKELDLFLTKNNRRWTTVGEAILHLPKADPPSETALRISKTIKQRRVNHGY
jgi:DNA (cytosine-5)-methyltransferase 1